jgi:hypothetical protein
VNDTVIADPLFTVPILVSPADLLAIGEKSCHSAMNFMGPPTHGLISSLIRVLMLMPTTRL